MSDLKIALIILGAFIIAGVVVYNWLQERNLRKEVTRDFIVPQKDVLADDFYIDADAYVEKELAGIVNKSKPSEPSISPGNSKKPALIEPVMSVMENSPLNEGANVKSSAHNSKTFIPTHPIEPHSESIVSADLHQQRQVVVANLPDAIHPQIDLTAILYATKNIGNKELQALKGVITDIGLPLAPNNLLLLHGLDGEDKWHLVSENLPDSSFKQIACSLQLADRGGPAAKNLLNKFQFVVEDSGLSLNAHVEWQGSGDALQRAIELDQFCIEVDQLISVHMTQIETPIHGTKFKGLAEANGLTLKADGKFYYVNSGKDELLFVLFDTNNQPFTAENLRTNILKSVTFQIEMPKVGNCEQVFNHMIIIAQKMATSLNARLVDDNQRSLGDLQIEKIRQQLKVIHATMVARGIMPGSPASMRLFN